MLHYQEENGQTNSAAQQEEGGHELSQGERAARRLLPLTRLARAGEPEPLEPLEVAVLPVTHQLLVELRQPLGLLGEGDPVASHGVPAAHGQHVALVILAHQVLQNCRVVNKRVEIVLLERLHTRLDRLLVVLAHIHVHVRKVLQHDKVCRAVGDCSESKQRLGGHGIGQPGVLDPGEVEVFLPGDHEGGQVGGVDGEEDEGEQGPDIGHEPGGVALGTVNIHRGLEQDHPDQPQRPHKREVALETEEEFQISLLLYTQL